MSTYRIKIDLRGYWHPGGGRGQGMVLDATCHRDADGLPVLPGRHLKGLLRDALERAQAWDWDQHDGLAAHLFGDRPEDTSDRTPNPGCLRVGDARLPEDIANHLTTKDGQALRTGLFRSLYATAVSHHTGTAEDRSLRGIEVVVPVPLFADISPIPGQEPPIDWEARLKAVLPLIDSVGAHRNRGLGRAVLTLEKVQ